MVVDTSIILAVYFNEPHAAWAAEQLNRNARELRMSSVNLTEALIRVRDRQPTLADTLEKQLLATGIRLSTAGTRWLSIETANPSGDRPLL